MTTIFFGPVIPADFKLRVLFHFGGEDGHQCDCAKFGWSVNGTFVAHLNFNNGSTGDTIYQGPYDLDLADYDTDACGNLIFSFTCESIADCGYCHEGVKIDVTRYNAEIITRYLSTSTPTTYSICDLMTGYSSPP